MSAKYANPDDDPRGAYILSELTVPGDNASRRYRLGGTLPPAGRSWRFDEPDLAKLEADGRIVFSVDRPKFKRYLNETRKALHNLLTSLPKTTFRSELEIIKKIVPKLAQILGYDEQEIFYDYGRGRLRADAIFSGSIEAAPWIILEIKGLRGGPIADWIDQVRRYLNSFDGRLAIVVSPNTFLLVSNHLEAQFNLRELSINQTEEILKFLEEVFAEEPNNSTTLAKRTLYSSIENLIEAAEVATTNKEKGKTLERLSQFLIDNAPSLSCKYTNLITRSSEIDIVIEYDSAKGSILLFEDVGRYSLVECKNWSKPVGASTVRDFLGKLEKTKTKMGIIFAKRGITGAESGLDALEEIRAKFSRDGVFVVVFSFEDLRGINDSKSFLEALDVKADNLRFATQG